MRWMVFALCALLSSAPFARAEKLAAAPSAIKFAPLSFKLPKTHRVQLKNGMVLHMLEDHELPTVDISAMVRTGSAWAAPEKAGLADLTGVLWRSGGTANISPEELDQRLEYMGTILETAIGRESGMVTLRTMTRDLDASLFLLSEIVKNPAFNEKRFAVAKNQMIESIKREEDDPETLADREFSKKVFAGHPFGAFPTVGTVQGITREECIRFYKDYIGPESFVIGIAGDFDSRDMVEKMERLFADFQPASKKFSALPPVPDAVTPGVYLVDKDIPQTNLRIGHIGLSRKNPDFDSIRVLNYVLGGGGFASRLMKEVRTVRGLAYSVWSYFMGGDMDKGAFIVGGETKASTTGEFATVSVDLIRQVIDKGITPQELALAKEALINSFVFTFDKNVDVVSRYTWMEYYGMPEDYLDRYRERVDAITAEKVRESAKKYLHPDALVVVAVGDRKSINGQIGSFGEVNVIEPAK